MNQIDEFISINLKTKIMKNVLLVFLGVFVFCLHSIAQSSSSPILKENAEREWNTEAFIANRPIRADLIDRTVERLKMSYPEIKFLEIDPSSKEVTVTYDKSISLESYREIINYFKF